MGRALLLLASIVCLAAGLAVGLYLFAPSAADETNTSAINAFAMSDGMNMPGQDFKVVVLDSVDLEACASMCRAEKQCVGFVVSKPNFYGYTKPQCWLKPIVMQPIADPCCSSGRLKSAVAQSGS